MTNAPKNSTGDEPPKKQYERPRLEVYGNVREVTANLGMMSATSDNAHGPNNKTS